MLPQLSPLPLSNPKRADTAAPRSGPDGGMDSALARVADTVPGFGGAFTDRRGHLTVFLTDSRRAEAARQALAAIGGPVGAAAVRSRAVTVRQARFDYAQLFTWKTRLRSQVFQIPTVVSLDIREDENIIAIGVATDKDTSNVRRSIVQAGVPLAAAIIVKADRVHAAARLDSYVRPVRAGLQISFLSGTQEYLCTLGLVAKQSGSVVVATNSHCSVTMGHDENTQYYQPFNQAGNYVGFELKDPPFFTDSRCPSGYRCRNSDSLLLQPQANITTKFGYIARTTERVTSVGSININSTSPTIAINGEATFPGLREDLDKIGRKTGWTHGLVTNTCVDVNEGRPDGLSPDVIIKCSDFVHAGVGGGDSGSPVFRYINGKATVIGLLFGESSSGSLVFSSMQNIEDELGPLQVY